MTGYKISVKQWTLVIIPNKKNRLEWQGFISRGFNILLAPNVKLAACQKLLKVIVCPWVCFGSRYAQAKPRLMCKWTFQLWKDKKENQSLAKCNCLYKIKYMTTSMANFWEQSIDSKKLSWKIKNIMPHVSLVFFTNTQPLLAPPLYETHPQALPFSLALWRHHLEARSVHLIADYGEQSWFLDISVIEVVVLTLNLRNQALQKTETGKKLDCNKWVIQPAASATAQKNTQNRSTESSK